MQIKSFHAESFSAAMEQVKKELGEHALILKSQSLNEAMGRGKNRKGVEITATIDPSYRESSDIISEEQSTQTTSNFLNGIDVKPMLMTLLSQTDRARAFGLKGYQISLYNKLIERGINEEMLSRMFGRLNSKKNQTRNRNAETDEKVIYKFMERAIVCSGPTIAQNGYPKIIALVGPTGVGKTTTIAKLAAQYALKRTKQVAIISLDTYRIGAVDQLKVYGEIMKVPVETAEDDRQYRKALHKHYNKDLIFVDTTGKSYKDPAHAGRLKEILRTSGPAEIHLALGANLKERVWEESHRQFSLLKIDRTLITKLDESTDFGSLFNYSLQTRIPYSFFTNGQRVPEDIELASPDRVIQLIFNSIRARLGG